MECALMCQTAPNRACSSASIASSSSWYGPMKARDPILDLRNRQQAVIDRNIAADQAPDQAQPHLRPLAGRDRMGPVIGQHPRIDLGFMTVGIDIAPGKSAFRKPAP